MRSSPLAATNAAGGLLWREDYTGYGERLRREPQGMVPVGTPPATGPPAGNRAWFTGAVLDEATGLAAFGARVYDASLGRFLSIDPEGFREAAPHSVHRTGYAFNAPTRYADPDGRHPVLLFVYAVPPAATSGVALFNFGSRAIPFALRAIPAALNRVTQLAHHPGTHAAVETAASIATNTPGSISGAASSAGAKGFIDPFAVRFTQDSVKGVFRNGSTLNDAAAALRAGGPKAGAQFPAIRLVQHEGYLFTLDNRRLLTFSQAGQPVPFRMATEAEIAREWSSKFTTTGAQGWGEFITVRP